MCTKLRKYHFKNITIALFWQFLAHRAVTFFTHVLYTALHVFTFLV